MSARYDEAVAALDDEQHLIRLADSGTPDDGQVLARGAAHALQRAQALGLLALAEEVEALVELLRDRVRPGLDVCGHVMGSTCRGCDHATHHGSACLARVIAASGGEEMCRCRFDEETSTQAAPVVLCEMRMKTGSSIRCTLTDRHPAAVLHADDHGNTWSSCCDMTPGHDGECGWRA